MSPTRSTLAASLPGYDLGGELGRGGWGIVRDATRRVDGRAVAIKELPAAFAADRAVRSRFTQVAHMLRGLHHPHVVGVLDTAERGGVCVLVLERTGTTNLWGDFVVNGMTAPRAVAAVLDAAAGLQALHEHGIVHRDLKPENLAYGADGRVKVADAGLARIIGGPATMATTDGRVLGTPAYLAPEQALGHPTSAATDLYALGTILYELLTGTLPHPDDGNPLSTLRHRLDAPPTPITDVAPGVPARLGALVMRAISRHPDERPQTAAAFAEDLRSAAADAWGADWQAIADLPLDHRLVRPAVIGHPVGGTAAQLTPGALLPVRTLTVLPPSPRPLMLGAAVAALVALSVVTLGFGSPAGRGGAPVELGAADPMAIDLGNPVVITSTGPPGPMAAIVSVAGIDVARVERQATDAGGGRRRATFDLDHARYVTSGESTLRVVEVSDSGDRPVGGVAIHASRSGWLSVPALGALVVGLAALAYAATMLAPARRGRALRFHRLAGLGLAAAVGGIALYVLGWAGGAPEPTRVGAVVVAVLSALGAVLFGIGRARWARRRQARSAANHLAAARAAAERREAQARKLAAREAAT